MSVFTKILQLSAQLLPTGRAWRVKPNGNMDKLFKALGVTSAKAYNDAVSIRDSLIPDTDRFATDDATDWERRLGLFSNPSLLLVNRTAVILRKMQAPGLKNPARGHYLWIQKQLQDAGFNVFVYENIPTVNPATLYPAAFSNVQQGQFQQGQRKQGGFYNNLVVNSIDNSVDILFDLGQNLRSSFIIAGATSSTAAVVQIARRDEFRQQVLQLKQAQNAAILFINYV